MATLGQALDEYLEDVDGVNTVYLYLDDQANPHVVINRSESEWDYTRVITVDNNLKSEIRERRKEVESLQAKVRALNREQKSIESAIAKLVKYK